MLALEVGHGHAASMHACTVQQQEMVSLRTWTCQECSHLDAVLRKQRQRRLDVLVPVTLCMCNNKGVSAPSNTILMPTKLQA